MWLSKLSTSYINKTSKKNKKSNFKAKFCEINAQIYITNTTKPYYCVMYRQYLIINFFPK